MLQITPDFKENVVIALLAKRENYDGTDAAFAKTVGINGAVFSRIKNGERESLLKDAQWLNVGRLLDVSPSERKWKIVKTEVFEMIAEEILFCKAFAKAKICVDEPEIGKTTTAKYLARTEKNCFYVDGSQAKTKQLFIRLIAKTIGVDHQGKYADIKANIKYYLRMLPAPIVIIDEAGDIDYSAFLELKELWNATDGACGWYLMGAEGLRAKIDRGISNKKVGYKEIFSRFSGRITTVVPSDRKERQDFYNRMLTLVLEANMDDKTNLKQIVRRCLTIDDGGYIGGLRRAESLLILENQ